MAAAAAAEVEHGRAALGMQVADHSIDERGGFGLIAMSVKPVIVRRIKPRREPVGLYGNVGSSCCDAHVAVISAGG